MKDSTLLKLSLLFSLVGICSLFFILQFVELEESRIVELEYMDEDSEVKIIGVVESVRKRNNVTMLSISQKEIVNGIIFDDVNVSNGIEVEVYGTLTSYYDKKEIIIEKIKLI
ncbi:hypothetical protein HQ533_04245 [Candidatus Woesearchaeota archaeon]|nr:hypothetical protein [Candidatus Woesearchaeota archaeon]